MPDVVVEIISPDSRGLDTRTKFEDYQRAGVKECWLIDPLEQSMTFHRLHSDRYQKAPRGEDAYESAAVPGFRLDLATLRAAFRAIG